MSQNPIKTCDHCGATGKMPTFMSGETTCFDCLKKGDRRNWKREDVEAYCRDNGLVLVSASPDPLRIRELFAEMCSNDDVNDDNLGLEFLLAAFQEQAL